MKNHLVLEKVAEGGWHRVDHTGSTGGRQRAVEGKGGREDEVSGGVGEEQGESSGGETCWEEPCMGRGGPIQVQVGRMRQAVQVQERLSHTCTENARPSKGTSLLRLLKMQHGLWVLGSTTEPREGMRRDCSIDKRDESLWEVRTRGL